MRHVRASVLQHQAYPSRAVPLLQPLPHHILHAPQDAGEETAYGEVLEVCAGLHAVGFMNE